MMDIQGDGTAGIGREHRGGQKKGHRDGRRGS